MRLWFALVVIGKHRRRPAVLASARRGGPGAPELLAPVTTEYREFYRGRKVMITGGLGFIGSNLARQLVDLGADVLLVDSLIPDYGGNLFNIDGIADRVRVNVADIRQQATMNYLVRDRSVIFNLAGQVSHIDSMRDPYTRSRDQLPEPADDSRGVPLQQPDREGGIRQHATDLRPSLVAAGRREPSRAADRRERHQQGRRRVLSSRLQQRLRRQRLFASAHERLRPASAAEAQPPGLHRLVHPSGGRKQDDSDLRRRFAVRDFVYVDDAADAFLRAGASASCNGEAFNVGGDRPISLRDLTQLLIEVAGYWTRRVHRVAGGQEADRHRELLRRLDEVQTRDRLAAAHAARRWFADDRVVLSRTLEALRGSRLDAGTGVTRIPFMSLVPGEDAAAVRAAIDRVVAQRMVRSRAGGRRVRNRVRVGDGRPLRGRRRQRHRCDRADSPRARHRRGRRSHHDAALGSVLGARDHDGRRAAGVR